MRTIEIQEPKDFMNVEVKPCPIVVIQRALNFAIDVPNMLVKIFPDRPGRSNDWLMYFSSPDGFKFTIGAIEREDGSYSFHS